MGRGSFWSWFDVNRSIFDEDIIIFVPVTLTFDLLILELHHHWQSPCEATSQKNINCLYRVPVYSERKVAYVRYVTERQTDKYHKSRIRWWNAFGMCRMGRWSFWSCFDVNRSTYDEDILEKRLLHFRFKWPWPLTFTCRFAPVVQHCFRQIGSFRGFPVSRKSKARDGRTDRRTRCCNT